ncbi:MAG: hypothetical protein HYS55_06290 [Candidatus Omnitrophica bacterium]|nr:hypothetical protein [Candidatus Omnitrophota bacterium]
MNKPCLLAYVSDLYFQSRIEAIAEAKKLDFYFATQGEPLSELVKNFSAFMLVVDLTELNPDWIFRHLSEVLHRDNTFPIVGFVSHVQEAVRERAEKYGCYRVYTKSELLKKLPDTIETVLRKMN